MASRAGWWLAPAIAGFVAAIVWDHLMQALGWDGTWQSFLVAVLVLVAGLLARRALDRPRPEDHHGADGSA